MPTSITATVKFNHGNLLTAANAHRIVAKDSILEFRVHHEKDGYSFRDTTGAARLCGTHPNIRALVIAAIFSSPGNAITVEVEDLKTP